MDLSKANLNKRISDRPYGEIEFFRALAIVLMVIFHLVYDLQEFAGVNVNYQDPFWFWLGKTAALLFMFIAGLSSGFSRSSVKRGFKVLLYGMGITLVTYLVMKDQYVRFGILHFLGVTMILSPLLSRLSSIALGVLAATSALLGFAFQGHRWVETSLLLPFGLMNEGFQSMDYYPLFPYLGMTILGILAYRHFYEHRSVPRFSFQLKSEPIRWLSRNSLVIYLVHQPLLIFSIISILFLIKLWQ